MTKSSRALARTWPYTRYTSYEQNLRQTAAQWFAGRGYPVSAQYAYVLKDLTLWSHNIILPEVAGYIEDDRQARIQGGQGFPLHKYLHHGLSSQAMVFNLIGPLIARRDLEPLRAALATANIRWPEGEVKAYFECEDRAVFNEDTGQPTSIDLVIEGAAARGIFIEAKLVEREFGGCSVFATGDCDGQNAAPDFDRCYLHHVGRRYWPRLQEFGFLQGQFQTSPVCLLAMYYQFFREVVFALAKGGDFVLLYDERNPAFYRHAAAGQRGLMPFLMQFVPAEHRARVHSLPLQHVVAAVEMSDRHGDWIGDFKQKYGLQEA